MIKIVLGVLGIIAGWQMMGCTPPAVSEPCSDEFESFSVANFEYRAWQERYTDCLGNPDFYVPGEHSWLEYAHPELICVPYFDSMGQNETFYYSWLENANHEYEVCQLELDMSI